MMASRASYSFAFTFRPIFLPTFIGLFLMVLLQEITPIVVAQTTNIGAILSMDSRMGKEQKLAMQIAVKELSSGNHNISLHFIDFNGSSLQTAVAAATLIKDNGVQVILVGIDNWQATTLIAQVGSLNKVPIFSLGSSPPFTSSFASLQWPFLIQMSHNTTEQVLNLASIIHAYHWPKVIVVYEDDPIDGNIGITLLTKALQSIGSHVECELVLPSYVSTVNLEGATREAITNLVNKTCYSRVFIVLKVSLSYIENLFKEAKEMGLMVPDSVWITTKAISDFLPSLNDTTMSNMEGVLGIMTKYDNSTISFQTFRAQLEIDFLRIYGEYHDYPSYQSLLAHDVITSITKTTVILRNTRNKAASDDKLLREILQCNFSGLSGQVYFDQDHNTIVKPPTSILVNIVGEKYQEVLDFSHDDIGEDGTAEALASKVTWPGNLESAHGIPKGWAMPINTMRMRIGVPVVHHYKNFIDYQGGNQSGYCQSRKRVVSTGNESYKGFTIDLFKQVQDHLGYCLPYDFIPFNGSYDDLVLSVQNKTFDAAVGDITILANRSEFVDFTLPYLESGLSIVFPIVESYNSRGTWIFLRPFTLKMWLVTLAVFVYTMLIIWVLEHGDNSEFKGTWKEQVNATVWFAFNSLYFAQREKISSKLARVVVIMWLFIVLVLTTSYTANLSSMLTNERLNQTIMDVESLNRTGAKVGYDNSTFIRGFLENPLHFNSLNTIAIGGGKFEEFHKEFQAGNIAAALLEVVYAQLFLNQYCNKYTMTNPVYRYGGLGFVFPKGSPIATDVSEAILILTENGELKKLEVKWLNTTSKCIDTGDEATNGNDGEKNSLSAKSFWVLFLISCATTTVCFLVSLISLFNNYWRRVTPTEDVLVNVDNNYTSGSLTLESVREVQIH